MEGLCRDAPFSSAFVLAFGVFRACMGPVVHPCRVKSFRKAASSVMDDLEKCHLIIDNLHLSLTDKLD